MQQLRAARAVGLGACEFRNIFQTQRAPELRTEGVVLNQFRNVSGQVPNLQKFYILFSKSVDSNTRSIIKSIFPIPDLQPHTKHLSHPIIFNHNDRNRAYKFILNKFRDKLTTVKANKLNHAGRLTYIQSVLSLISIYYMSTVLFSKSFLQQITAIIRKFW